MKIRRKYLFYALAFASAIITAGVSAIDATIIAFHIPDPWAFGLSCFLVGTIITLLIVLVFSIPVKGKSLGSLLVILHYSLYLVIRLR
jgi:hypothetical protein